MTEEMRARLSYSADVDDFLNVGSAKLIVCSLRSLRGWLHVTGQVPMSLATAVHRWRVGGCQACPKGLEPAELRRLLCSCYRRTTVGRP
ncbi:hypothetical protein KNN17_21190, partial [Arthrobacter bambusae]|uniref:hypothetical protein n=1 Tax=Arthrobacter bambusae TaxID=1338426 RepID=UPI001F50FCA6